MNLRLAVIGVAALAVAVLSCSLVIIANGALALIDIIATALEATP